MKAKYLIYTALATGLCFSQGCTKIDEGAYDVVLASDFYTNKNEVISALLRPYTHANAWVTPAGQDNLWRASELSADQLAWPTKGRHGEDGGKWKRFHYHSWTVDESGLNQAWILLFGGLGYCNSPIEIISSSDLGRMGITAQERDAYVAELKLLRAFHYLKAMDLWGNLPIATNTTDPLRPSTSTRVEVFNFIEKEIKDNIAAAPKLSRGMVGRMSQAGAYAMLTELYLNAEVWTGTARWDDCIAAADMVISGQGGAQNGTMALDPNIKDQFKTTNDLSKEAIFSIAYNYTVAAFEPSWPGEFYHFKQREIYGGGRNGNDGIVLVPGVYTTYADNDLRKKEWLLEGPQLNFTTGAPVTGSEEYNNQPLVFVDNIRKNRASSTVSTMSEGEENSGVRFNKYKLGNSAPGLGGIAIDPNYNNTDWNVYRLTWIYFAKAEALMRKNGGAADAVSLKLINDSRSRSFAAADQGAAAFTASSLTLDALLAERGREFIFEGFRRQDLIRFNKFTTATWWDHTPSTATRNLYPIPQQQRDLNPNLTQNPGYN
ncbi:MAG: RagB/SusD family nutrient uptake outer membrane protein [Pedobacter sp.]